MNYVDSRRERLKHNGFVLSKTYGSSMRPLIWGGEHYVAVAPLEGEPGVGDLLMFVQRVDGEERSIVHRLVEIRDGADAARGVVTADVRYITRGDNCLGCESVSREEIIGRVAEVHRITGFRPWHAIPLRKFAVGGRAYRWYSRVWTAIWPLRRVYYRIRASVYAMCHRG